MGAIEGRRAHVIICEACAKKEREDRNFLSSSCLVYYILL